MSRLVAFVVVAGVVTFAACSNGRGSADAGAGSGGSGGGSGTGGSSGGSGAGGGAGSAGTGGTPLTTCPTTPGPISGLACTGTFICTYNNACTCNGCCQSTFRCMNDRVVFLGSDDGCFQRPCPQDAGQPDTQVDAMPDTGAGGSGATLKVQYRWVESDASRISAAVRLVNGRTTPVPLSTIKMRYWYTQDTVPRMQLFGCLSTSTLNCSTIYTVFGGNDLRQGADAYLEVGFQDQAGNLAAGAQVEIDFAIRNNSSSTYDLSNDYSTDVTQLTFVDWSRITLHDASGLIWGVEPPQL